MLLLAFILLLILWPVFGIYYLANILDFPLGYLIIICINFLVLKVCLKVAIKTGFALLYINSFLLIVLIIAMIWSFFAGYLSPTSLFYWDEYDSDIAKYNNVFSGEVTVSMRRAYFKKVYFPKERIINKTKKASFFLQISPEALKGKIVIKSFLDNLQEMDISSAEKKLIYKAIIMEISKTNQNKYSEMSRDELLKLIYKYSLILYSTVYSNQSEIKSEEEFIGFIHSYSNEQLIQGINEFKDEIISGGSLDGLNIRNSLKRKSAYQISNFQSEIQSMKKINKMKVLYITDDIMKIQFGRDSYQFFELRLYKGKWYISNLPEIILKII